MNRRDESWNFRFQQLAEYKQTHAGNCNVSRDYAPIPELGHWVDRQRVVKRQKKISVEREKKLNAIGFVWKKKVRSSYDSYMNNKTPQPQTTTADTTCTTTTRTNWNTRLQQLLEYKQEFGDCKVPYNFSRNRQLGEWVRKQRWRNNKTLTEERRSRLNVIGFNWGKHEEIGRAAAATTTTTTSRTTNNPVSSLLLRETRVAELRSSSEAVFETHDDENYWETRFRELLDHFQANGDFNVHQYYPHNPLLARWVSEQRYDYDLKGRGDEKTLLTPLREAKLNAIGFAWFVNVDDGDAAAVSSTAVVVVQPEEAKS